MNIYVQAHPDDEGSMIGLLENTSTYKVFAVLTAGDQTGYCDGSALDRTYEYQPVAGFPHAVNSQGCIDNRRDSFHKFHDDQAAYDAGWETRGTLTTITGAVLAGDVTPDDGGAAGDARTVQFFVGAKNARVMFSLGDGDLTPGEVTWAIQTIKRNRSLFPAGLTQRDVLATSYANTPDFLPAASPQSVWTTSVTSGPYSGCSSYAHTDHVAVNRALYYNDYFPEEASSSQYGNTCKNDPKVVLNKSASDTRWNHLKNTTNGLGPFQHRYGWLVVGHWPMTSGTDQSATFHQMTSLWRRF